MMYGSWETNFLVILDYFVALLHPNNMKNQNFEKMKKLPGDIIILHMCTTNENHMMYVSWDMEHGRHNFFSFWTIFCLFTPSNNPENQNFKKMKKLPRNIIISHKYTKTHDHMLCCSLDMAHNGINCYFSFWAIFCPFTSLTAQKINFKKIKKTPGDIIILQ